MPCVQLIRFALPFRQSNFISNRKAKNVEVFSSDILRYYAVLIWSRRNSVTATGRAVLPVFSISLCPVKAESPPQRGRNHLLYPILIMCVTWEVAVFEFVAVFLSNAHSLRLCPSPQASATTEMGLLGKKMSSVVTADPVVHPQWGRRPFSLDT